MNDLSLPIRGERVSIRHLEEHDLANWYALETDPEVKRYIGGAVRYSVDEFGNPSHHLLLVQRKTRSLHPNRRIRPDGRVSTATVRTL